MNPAPLREASIPELELLHRGKVRDLFAVEDKLLIVATDRVSAFDVVLPDALPHKGEVLSRISEFWFRHFESQVRHHLITLDVAQMPAPLPSHPELNGRSMLCQRVEPLKAEFVVRGYLAGSGYKDYMKSGSVCGIPLPAGLRNGDKLPEPIFTPSTKADQGLHDENISFDKLCEIIGGKKAEQARDLVMNLYRQAHDYAEERGILLADTKIEVGEDADGLLIIDELFTPDSSRFWPKDRYSPGSSQPSYDKQIIRDALEATDWDKTPPGPRLPQEILDRAVQAYREIFEKLTESAFRETTT
jgi:phosphoribosylaminoimidazole-succinocarboxamide synthase